MNLFARNTVNAALMALTLTATAVLVALALSPWLEDNIFTPFLIAVCICSWYYSRVGGVFATAASIIAIRLLRHTAIPVAPPGAQLFAQLLAFSATALLMTWAISAWRESRTLHESMLSSISDAVIATDPVGRITFINPAAETLLGQSVREVRKRPVGSIVKLIREEGREAIENPLERALQERVAVAGSETALLLTKSGTQVPVDHSAAPVRDRAGVVRGGVFVLRDVSARRRLDEQLTHARKMDAVGRVADGVAGDFNNLLTVITGYSAVLREQLPQGHRLRSAAEEITRAAERAAALTRRLLVFSRGGGAEPRLLDLNSVLHGIEPTLRRLVGDRVELILVLSPRLGKVKADPAQIEQVLVNLVTNARDAMPDGGRLVIETADVDIDATAEGSSAGVPAGSYVMMAVSDTGVGMDAETRSRAFEPFFTTKPGGTGTGLGLAMVYGAVRQSDGQITVYSQPGCGSIFEVYLPRVGEVEEVPHAASTRGSETILVVDDEDGVRGLVSSVLRENGYDVLEANQSAAALSLYEKNAHKIDLVLTDVVMPYMNGIRFGHMLTERAPGVKILYMSGYRDDPARIGVQEMPRPILQKPFTPDLLLTRVREVLDASPAK